MSYAIVFVGFLFQNLLQFALQLILAWVYGTDASMDAYYAAMTLPVAVSSIVAGGIQPLIVTAIGQDKTSTDRTSAVPLLVWVPLLGCCGLAGVGGGIAESLMGLLHPGFPPEKIAETASLFRVLVWLIPLNSAIGLMQAVLNGMLIFGVPSLAGVLGPLLTVCLVPGLASQMGIAAVAWATVAGAILNVAMQTPLAVRLIIHRTRPGSWEKVRSLVPLAVPILIGMFLLKVDPLVDRYVSSYLDDGSIARLGYAFRVVTIFVTLASGTLSTVAFPVISQKAALGRDELLREVAYALRTLLTLVVPAVAVLVLFARPLVRDLFERGAFAGDDTIAVAGLIQIYAVFLVGAALGELITKVFYVLNDSRTPTMVGGICLLLGMGVKFWIVPEQGIFALAWIAAGVMIGAATCTTTLLFRRVGWGMFEGIVPHGLRCLLATGVAVGMGLLILQGGFAFAAIVGLGIGAVGYFAILCLLDTETRTAIEKFMRRHP